VTQALPCIEVRPEPASVGRFNKGDDILGNLVGILASSRGGMDRGVGQVIKALVAEGRHFRETDSGKRWLSVLATSKLAANGWMLWNLLDLDRHVTGRDETAGDDTPSAMLEDLFHQIASVNIEQLIQLAGDTWQDEAQHV
jgi:hypothetical protein